MMAYVNLPYLFAMLLLAVGLYAIVAKKNLIKVIVGVMVIEYAVNLMLVLVGYRTGGEAPILTEAGQSTAGFVDPLPQALVLTAIVIGVAILALALSLAIRLYQHYGTLNLQKIREQRW